LQERYGSHDGYAAAVTKAASRAMEEGFLLQPDATALINAAQASAVLR
jgi:Alpha/beta hydrolase domain